VSTTAASAPGERALLTVCVCTYKRPEVLRILLGRLASCAEGASEVAEVGVVVVDDDPAASAATVAQAAGSSFARGVRYEATGSGNVSTARNRAIELGIEDADWLATIDDDCLPSEAWLRELVVVQRRTGAECVSGACDTELPPEAPRWLREQPFHDDATTGTDGDAISMGYMKNSLFSSLFITEHGLRFDPRFGEIGGEDAMFFLSAHAVGMHHVYAAHALVREQLPAERANLRYQMRRRFWYGNTEAVTSIASGRASRARMAASAGTMAMSGVLNPVRRAARGQRPQLLFHASELLRAAGRLLGAAGVKLEHR